MAVPPAPVPVLSQRSRAPSVASVTSVANDKGDNEMILGAVHRSPGICLIAEENPRKPQLGDRLMKSKLTRRFFFTDAYAISGLTMASVRGKHFVCKVSSVLNMYTSLETCSLFTC